MHIVIKLIAACMVGVLLMSCAGRRAARQAEHKDAFMHRQGFACTAPANAACEGCTVTCAMGSPATCTAGKLQGDKCAVNAVCRCGKP